jgi:hypothetical protein
MPRSDGVLDVSLVPFNADADAVKAHPGLQAGLHTRLTVTDNGIGMAADIQDRVFEPFFTSRPSGEGTGLGLWLVREIVQALRGLIELRSREGEGATFDIFLPAAEEEMAAKSSRRPSGEDVDVRPHVLYVEDEAPLAELGRRRLEAAGFRVTVFTSSVRALENVRACPNGFDILVTDNTMPRLSGLELAEAAVRLRPGLPVLMVSGLAKMRLEDVPDFITRVLPKPHSSEELVRTVTELVPLARS